MKYWIKNGTLIIRDGYLEFTDDDLPKAPDLGRGPYSERRVAERRVAERRARADSETPA